MLSGGWALQIDLQGTTCLCQTVVVQLKCPKEDMQLAKPFGQLTRISLFRTFPACHFLADADVQRLPQWIEAYALMAACSSASAKPGRPPTPTPMRSVRLADQ
jgi:hypothetical protein